MNLPIDYLEEKYSKQLEELRADLQQHIKKGTQNVAKFLSSSDLDSKLVQFVILNDGTPRGLAEFSSRNQKNMALIDKLLNGTALMKEMLLADGSKALPKGPAQYGPAMRIYDDIMNASEHATWGGTDVFSRLALAIALEHAVPISQNNPKSEEGEMDTHINPVRRYLNYEMAYLNGELDPAFDVLTTWELRFVVDGNEPDKIAAWGRAMLRNYRPDHVLERRYVRMVNSNIRYGSQDVKHDSDELQQYQNILMNGGVCGRRAFFGRFILRAFGIPTTARPSKGHGALVHWTPDQGWKVELGPGWGSGWTNTLYHNDLDFLATVQARTNEDEYWKVKRAQWIGSVMTERRIYGERDKINGDSWLWYGKSLQIQRTIIDASSDKKKIERVGNSTCDLRPTVIERVLATPVLPDAKTIISKNDGNLIVVPAAAYQKPRQTKDVHVMHSFDGGLQIYLPSFSSQGLTIMRGGTWKNDALGCCSGARIKSGGYGKYEDWGFRLAMSSNDDSNSCPPGEATFYLDNDGMIKIELLYIKPGSFLMGGESNADGRFQCIELPKHQVHITKGFYMGKYPVTQAQYQAVMGLNPSKSTKSPHCPVDSIGEQDALDFCDRLVETIGRAFRLPTEAEWEYACRGDQGDKKWFFGDDPSQLHPYAWFKENSGGNSHPVGQKKPNPFGIYDMYGNVYERVSDKYAKEYYAHSPLFDPPGPVQGTMSMIEYKIHIPSQGAFTAAAEVVTVNKNQRLNVNVNDNTASEAIMELPFTNGSWQIGPSVSLLLKEGENTIRLWRDKPPQYGIAIRKIIIQAPEEHNFN